MIRLIIASLWLALTFWAHAPDAAAQEAASQHYQEYQVRPIAWGDTVSQMCQQIPSVVRGTTIYGCAYKALADSGIEDDRNIPVGTNIYLPVAPGYGSAQATTPSEDSSQGFSSSLPAHEISSPARQQAAHRQGSAVGIVIIVLVLLAVVIIAVAIVARHLRKESVMNQQRQGQNNGQGGSHNSGSRIRDTFGGGRGDRNNGNQQRQSDRVDGDEAAASPPTNAERPQGEQRPAGGDASPRQRDQAYVDRTGNTPEGALEALFRAGEGLFQEAAEERDRRIEAEQKLAVADDKIAAQERELADANRKAATDRSARQEAERQLALAQEEIQRKERLLTEANERARQAESRAGVRAAHEARITETPRGDRTQQRPQ